jgi:hypothetical protein
MPSSSTRCHLATVWYVSLVDSATSISAHAANGLVGVDGLKCGLSFTVARTSERW